MSYFCRVKAGALRGRQPPLEGVAENAAGVCSEGKAFPSFFFVKKQSFLNFFSLFLKNFSEFL